MAERPTYRPDPRLAQACIDDQYATSFRGVLPERRTRRAGDPAYHCPKLKGDDLQRPPGWSRSTLTRILERTISQHIQAKAVC